MEIGNWHLGLEGTVDANAILRDENAENNNNYTAIDFVYREKEEADVLILLWNTENSMSLLTIPVSLAAYACRPPVFA